MSGDTMIGTIIDFKSVTFQSIRHEAAVLLPSLTLFAVVIYFGLKWMVRRIDPTRKQKVEAEKKAKQILNRIGVKNVTLSEYEFSIAAHLVDPTAIGVSWADIAGLEDIIREIRESVILPIQKRQLFTGSMLVQPPKGVLLYGPPGCGKTMIAKATAKEAGAHFINIEVSALMDKWYGESQKLAAAVFTLATKIQPCIIFVDEIDCFLRSRDFFDHEATAMIKAQFMRLWDGLVTDPACQIVVMGATNRPQDVDRAILRRMPSTFHIGLPNEKQRADILNLVLDTEVISDNVDVIQLASLTKGFPGSDLRELCRIAALYRVREYCKEEMKRDKLDSSASDSEVPYDALRPISMEDFENALRRMLDSEAHTGARLEPRASG